jgi:hypothetical protein
MSGDAFALIGGGLLFLVLLGLAVREFLRPRAERQGEAIAVIEERVTFTIGGGVALLMLVISIAGAAMWFLAARTVIEQAAVGAVFTANAVIWGVGIVVGRRRTYVVRRAPPGEPGD